MTADQLINQTSGEVEWFTPSKIIAAAREAMGSINLDPASCKRANTMIVNADHYFTKEIDGLSKQWIAKTVWLNHPFGRTATPLWIAKLFSEYNAKSFDQACIITYASTSEKWFQPLLKFPQCFIHGRTNYIAEDDLMAVRGASKGSVVTYFGDRRSDFAHAFSKLGTTKIEYL